MELPNLRKQPSYNTILRALLALKIEPATWNATNISSESDDQVAALRFLNSIISSDLDWLNDLSFYNGTALSYVDQKDMLLGLASKRMAERCGRTAMPDMTRTWVIPASDCLPEIKIDLREPTLTGDNLGLKTWGTAYALALILEQIGTEYLSQLLSKRDTYATATGEEVLVPCTKVLELGSGTGLVGIAAAAVWGLDVTLTDLEDVKDNLGFNIQENSDKVVEVRGGHVTAEVLNWNHPDEALASCPTKEFELVIAADCFYDDEHPALVAKMIKRFLKDNTDSRALVAMPIRDDMTSKLALAFERSMNKLGFSKEVCGAKPCRDDWEVGEVVDMEWEIWGNENCIREPMVWGTAIGLSRES